MASATQTITRAQQYRSAGIVAMLGGLCYVVAAIVLHRTGDDSDAVGNLLAALWAVGAIAGLVGIGMLGVAGRGLLGRIGLAIAALAYAVVALDALLVVADVYRVEDSVLFPISRLGTLVGMLLVGIATVAARRWSSWRRFAPFAVLAALPIAIAVSAATETEAGIAAIGVAWLVIGYAVWSTTSD